MSLTMGLVNQKKEHTQIEDKSSTAINALQVSINDMFTVRIRTPISAGPAVVMLVVAHT